MLNGALSQKIYKHLTCPIVITVINVIIDNKTVQNKISRHMTLSCSITIHTPHVSYKDRLYMYSRAKCTKITKDTVQWITALKVYRVLAGLSQDVILQHDNVTAHCTVRHKSCCSHYSNIHHAVWTAAVIPVSCLMQKWL